MLTIGNEPESESESEDESYQGITNDKTVSPKDLYFIPMEINKLLKESTGIDADWPPDSNDLTFTKANLSIPIMLYNFLSWRLGFTSDPVTDEKVKINPTDEKKVVSIAQDLIYAESKGRKQLTSHWLLD